MRGKIMEFIGYGWKRSKRSANIYECKNKLHLNDLCGNLPKEFLLYMKYCRVLKFEQTPDYNLLRDIFINLFRTKKYNLDFVYDWNEVAKKKKQEMLNKTTELS